MTKAKQREILARINIQEWVDQMHRDQVRLTKKQGEWPTLHRKEAILPKGETANANRSNAEKLS